MLCEHMHMLPRPAPYPYSGIDYRTLGTSLDDTYFTPIGDSSRWAAHGSTALHGTARHKHA